MSSFSRFVELLMNGSVCSSLEGHPRSNTTNHQGSEHDIRKYSYVDFTMNGSLCGLVLACKCPHTRLSLALSL